MTGADLGTFCEFSPPSVGFYSFCNHVDHVHERPMLFGFTGIWRTIGLLGNTPQLSTFLRILADGLSLNL